MKDISKEQLSEIARGFRKDELISLCQELGIEFELHEMSRDIVKKLISDLDVNGIPDPYECSELMFNFMFNLGYIDEEGNVLEDKEAQPNEVENVKPEEPKVKYPPCWGHEDERDPACRRCKVQQICREYTQSIRPVCFGKLFDSSSEDCKNCLVAGLCRLAYAENVKVIKSIK